MSTIRLLAACRATSVRSIFLSSFFLCWKGVSQKGERERAAEKLNGKKEEVKGGKGRFVAPCELRSCYKMRNSVKLAGF